MPVLFILRRCELCRLAGEELRPLHELRLVRLGVLGLRVRDVSEKVISIAVEFTRSYRSGAERGARCRARKLEPQART